MQPPHGLAAVDRTCQPLARSSQVEHHRTSRSKGGSTMLETAPARMGELRELIGRHAGTAQAERLLRGVTLGQSTSPTPLAAHIALPMLALVAQGAKRAVLGNQIFDYGPGQ